MAQVIYVSIDYLTKNTNITSNVDANILRPSVIKAQDLYISPFLGKDLDNELKTAIQSTTGLTTIQVELLSLVKKAQAEFTAYMAYADILYRFLNKAATTQSSENGSAITREDLIWLRDIAKNDGEFYLRRVREFLIENKEIFPEWFKCFCYDNKQTYSDGIVYADYNLKYSNRRYRGNFPDGDGYNF